MENSLVGSVFDKLTVKEPVIVKEGRKNLTKWLCDCECGKQKICRKSDLTTGRQKSCGCGQHKRKDVIGKTFNGLTVLEYSHTNEFRTLFYKYRCHCGKEDIIQGGLLGIQKSCGCYQYNRVENFKYVTGHYFSIIKLGAKKRNLEFNIEREYLDKLFEKQNKKCALSGIDLNFETDKDRIGQIASVDRKDSSKGYTKKNVQWVHSKINIMKGSLSDEYFIYLCKLVSGKADPNDINEYYQNKNRLIKHSDITGSYLSRLKISANKRNLLFNIDKDFLMNLFNKQEGRCNYTKLLLSFDADVNRNGQTASLDRKDSSIGYEPDNVHWVHKDINMMKGSLTTKEFTELCLAVAIYNGCG